MTRRITEPESSRWILITGAGAVPECASCRRHPARPVMQVPDSLPEVNKSDISEFHPKAIFVLAGDDLVNPVRRSFPGERKEIELRAPLTPDSSTRTPPDVTVQSVKDARNMSAHFFRKSTITANMQQRFIFDRSGPEISAPSCQERHIFIALR